jgi:hypothetical protein
MTLKTLGALVTQHRPVYAINAVAGVSRLQRNGRLTLAGALRAGVLRRRRLASPQRCALLTCIRRPAARDLCLM